jgi:hypothetical protein
MNNMMSVPEPKFHTYLDSDVVFLPTRTIEKKETRYFILQERDLSYRFSLHQHPYVQPLIQRLIRKGTNGLQGADTEYAPGERSLPLGVDVALSANITSQIPSGSRIALYAKVTATDGGGANVELSKGSEFDIAANASVRISAGTVAVLVDQLEPTPFPRTLLNLPAAKKALPPVDTPVEFINATLVSLPDGTGVTFPAGTKVSLAAGAEFDIPVGTPVTILRRRMQPVKDLYAEFFEGFYGPNASLVQRPYPAKQLDFTSAGAYSIYNWELFYHVPITIAIHLGKNQRFADAQRWFHFLFDPTDDSDGPTPERFWKVRPFQSTDVKKIEEILVNLATGSDAALRNETIRSIEAWKDAPFRPHVVARYRQQAYMYKTVMAYLDNLIAWGDSLFRQDTGEAIDEAQMLYVLAADILGPKPLPVPKKGTVRPQNYANLRADLSQFGAVMREMEPDLPFDLMPFPSGGSGDNAALAPLRNLGKALYFCVPRNDKLMGYWDTVADRLFKIRNSLNIQGVFRQLALFEPPIDPAMLARAAAAGLDIGAIVNGINQPLPLVRFSLLVQRAAEIVQEVKSLGNSLLAAMEKEEGEAMALLRARHERVILEMVEHVKYGQLQEAIKAKEGLLQSLALAIQRYTFYEKELGKKAEEVEKAIPALNELDEDSLEKMKFSMQEPSIAPRPIEADIAQDLAASGGKIISSHEASEFGQLQNARAHYDSSVNYDLLGSFLSLIPEFGAQAEPMGVGAALKFGGMALAKQLSMAASCERVTGDRFTYEANKSSKIGGYARRELEWAFQSNLAAGEITQIFKQLRAAQIREAIAESDLKAHRQQMKHAEEIERFLNAEGSEKSGKKTNKSLYAWTKREVKGLYAQCFQFAYEIARKAERAFQHELGNTEATYLQFGYLAGKEGLLAGEKLYLDLKRMEMAYHDQNRREYELTSHVSLLQVDPLALVQLRATGRCTVRLRESLFDMQSAGHYFRRIKTAAITIPCVAGPYASVTCTLTLLKSSIRKTAVVGDQYARLDAEDTRFSDHSGAVQSIVTSSAQNDSGLFETNLRDERFLPFELSGVISEWQLELPAGVRQFDYDTISDVVLHLRYTAREGGALLRNAAVADLNDQIAQAQTTGSVRLLSVRHEFPTEWAKFKSSTVVTPQVAIPLRSEHYPLWSKNRLNALRQVQLFAKSDTALTVTYTGQNPNVAQLAARLGNLRGGKLAENDLPPPTGTLSLTLSTKAIDDLFILASWGDALN